MKKYRLIEILIDIIFWIFTAVLGILFKTGVIDAWPSWLVIAAILLFITYSILISRLKPSRKYTRLINKAYKLAKKDKAEAIRIFEEGLESESLYSSDKASISWMLSPMYLEKNEHKKAIEAIEKVLKLEDLNGSERIETLGHLVIVYMGISDFTSASYYCDEIISIMKQKSKYIIDKDALPIIFEAYLKNGENQKAREIYTELQYMKGFKRNKKVEEMLDF